MESNEACTKYYATEEAVASLEAAYESVEVVKQRDFTVKMLDAGKPGKAVGIDTSPAMIARARTRRGGDCEPERHVDYYVGTAVKLKTFAANTFDAIACVQVLCYVPKVHAAAAMLEMARVLKPGGRILILDTDWATRVIHTHDAERAARVLAIADADYGFADQHVPRKMPTLAKEARLRVHDVQGFTLVKAGSFVPGGYFDVVNWTEKHAPTNTEIREYAEEQRALSASGQFFYSCNRTLFLLKHAT